MTENNKLILCKMCGSPIKRGEYVHGNTKYCNTCHKVREKFTGQGICGYIVSLAKAAGFLPSLIEEDISCVDCGERAVAYDHRDYRYPLLVSPVCAKCNSERGAALPRVNVTPENFNDFT